MHVVVVNHNSADHLGGAERSLFAILDHWAGRNPQLRPIIVSPGQAPAVAAEVARRHWRHVPLAFEGWAVFSADGGRAEMRLRERAAAAATRALAELLHETGAELVVTNTLIHPWGAVAAAAAGVPHVWFVREFGHRDQGVIFPRGRPGALRAVGQLSHAVVANSEAVRAELAAEIPAEKLSVSYPPVDLPEVRRRALEPLPTAATAYPLPDALRVGVLGRVTRSKGQWRVVEALGLLHSQGVRAQACFVGRLLDPDVEAELRGRAAELGVADRISFAGEQPNPFPWMAAADVCVVPSQREAFGRSTIECLAIGRPVVATRDGAGAELITPEVGALFDADDVAGLAAALRRYAEDPSLARSQEAAARARADALMTGALEGAVAVLESAIGAPPATLPPEWAAWTARIDDLADGGRPRLWGTQAAVTRALRLGAKALRNPRKALARLHARRRLHLE